MHLIFFDAFQNTLQTLVRIAQNTWTCVPLTKYQYLFMILDFLFMKTYVQWNAQILKMPFRSLNKYKPKSVDTEPQTVPQTPCQDSQREKSLNSTYIKI